MLSCLILFSPEKDATTVAFHNKDYDMSYQKLYAVAEKKGLKLYRAALDWYDPINQEFVRAWRFENGSWVLGGALCPDILYDKTSNVPENQLLLDLLAKRFPLINDPAFTRIASNKYQVGQLLSKYCKPYFRVTTQAERVQALAAIPGESVVSKPEFGSGGVGVVIGTKQQIQQMELPSPVLLQEFIDSSRGIPDITAGHHDLRLVFINETLIYSYIRTPKKGSLLANVAQGGHMEIVAPQRLPTILQPAITAVHQAFSRFHKKIYTIDFIFDEQGNPWIVELNTKPGVYFSAHQESVQEAFYTALVEELLSLAPTK